MTDGLPIPEGFGKDVEIDLRWHPNVDEVPLKPGQLIRDYAQDYFLLQPAIAYLTIPWGCNPLVGFVAERAQDVRFQVLKSERPLFRGVPHPWDCWIWLFDKSQAADILQYYGTIALHDQTSRVLYRVRTQQIKLVEPHAINIQDLYTELPALVKESSAGCAYWVQQLHDQMLWSCAVNDPDRVYEDTYRFACALRLGLDDPYDPDFSGYLRDSPVEDETGDDESEYGLEGPEFLDDDDGFENEQDED